MLSPRGEQIGKDLITASAAVLLESFALVVGVIDVSVSVLRGERGQDVTYVCRKPDVQYSKRLLISPQNLDLKSSFENFCFMH